MFLTAWFALFELANVRHGERVLVHSAAGGVGGALVQLAKTAGCHVTAVVGSTHKIENAERHGADAVIDKQTDNLWETAKRLSPHGFDIVLDANGVATLAESYAHLAPMGRLVVYGFHTMLPRGRGKPRWLKLAWHYLRTPRFDPLRMTKQNRSVLAFNLSFLSEKTDLLNEAMNKIIELLVTGRIQALRTTAFPFDEAALAHKALETGQTVGKLILTLHDS